MSRAAAPTHAWVAAVLFALGGSCANAAQVLTGTLTGVGSDTASALVARWAEAFRAAHPRVLVQVQAAGSASAPTALIEGAADFGSMSRPMKQAEIAAFRARFGYAPTQVLVAHDAIAVFVHPDNPLTRITLVQLDAIYSADRRCGASAPVRAWRDLGLAADATMATASVLATGRNDASGTNEVFREEALCDGDYRADVVAWPGNGAVVATVATNREAIGYAGLGYVNGLIKPLALARSESDEAVLPDRAAVTQGRYPLSRALYLYVNRPAGGKLSELPAAFLAYALSDEGQALAQREGFTPLQTPERAVQRALLE